MPSPRRGVQVEFEDSDHGDAHAGEDENVESGAEDEIEEGENVESGAESVEGENVESGAEGENVESGDEGENVECTRKKHGSSWIIDPQDLYSANRA